MCILYGGYLLRLTLSSENSASTCAALGGDSPKIPNLTRKYGTSVHALA